MHIWKSQSDIKSCIAKKSDLLSGTCFFLIIPTLSHILKVEMILDAYDSHVIYISSIEFKHIYLYKSLCMYIMQAVICDGFCNMT